MGSFRKEHKTLESVKGDAFLTWLYALDNGYKSEQEMEVLSDMTEGLENFAIRYNYAINDPDLIRRYRFYEDGKRDEATRISVAERKAHLEDARKMKAEGIAADVISRVTGITTADIANL